MDIYALDKDFNLLSMAIPYDNLQWSRRYYQAGQFAAQMPLALYDPNWAYIGTPDRPELGMVQKLQSSDSTTILISGFFCEKMLDEKVCYPRYQGDAAQTETAVRSIFSQYKEDLPIILGAANTPLLGDRTQSDFSDDELGTKLYSILEPRELSYRVRYDYESNKLIFEVWQGLDRTQSQTENSWVTFSADFGNLQGRTFDMDDSAYKNYAIIPVDADEDGIEMDTFYVDLSNGGRKRKIVFDMRSETVSEELTEAEWKQAVMQEATERLMSYQKVEDIDVNVIQGEYLNSFDLGDKCSTELPDIGYSLESRIVEVNEVFKADGGHTVSVGLGNKRISNLRRAVSRL